MKRLDYADRYIRFLIKIHIRLSKPKIGAEFYIKLINDLEKLFPIKSKNLLQVDLSLKFKKKKISKNSLKKIANQIEEISFLTVSTESTRLKELKMKFMERFGMSSISLPHLLDSDIGLNYLSNKKQNEIDNSDQIVNQLQNIAIFKYNESQASKIKK